MDKCKILGKPELKNKICANEFIFNSINIYTINTETNTHFIYGKKIERTKKADATISLINIALISVLLKNDKSKDFNLIGIKIFLINFFHLH